MSVAADRFAQSLAVRVPCVAHFFCGLIIVRKALLERDQSHRQTGHNVADDSGAGLKADHDRASDLAGLARGHLSGPRLLSLYAETRPLRIRKFIHEVHDLRLLERHAGLQFAHRDGRFFDRGFLPAFLLSGLGSAAKTIFVKTALELSLLALEIGDQILKIGTMVLGDEGQKLFNRVYRHVGLPDQLLSLFDQGVSHLLVTSVRKRVQLADGTFHRGHLTAHFPRVCELFAGPQRPFSGDAKLRAVDGHTRLHRHPCRLRTIHIHRGRVCP